MVTKKILVSIVLPNYNGGELMALNVPKIIQNMQTHKKVMLGEIIVADDASSDNSKRIVNRLQKRFQKVPIRYLASKKQYGFSTNANKGVYHAKYNFVVLLNTDVYPKNNFLDYAIVHFENEKVFAVGFLDEDRTTGSVVLRGRGIGWWEKGLYVHRKGSVDKKDTSWVSGGSMMVRKDYFIHLGGFDEIYNPFYWEDIDLSYRAFKSGYTLVFEPKSIVVHEHKKGSIRTSYAASIIKEISYRNQFLFSLKNGGFKNYILLIIFFPLHMICAIKAKDSYFFKGFIKAVMRYIQFYKRYEKVFENT